MIAITGATGHLGQLVIEALLESLPASEIVAAARHPDKAGSLEALGVQVREADYDRPETLTTALAGVERLLLISSSAVGRRAAQHQAVIGAARQAGVALIVYTSLLHADRSPLGLAEEHRQTEAMLAASGIDHVILRNGWYTENYLAGIPRSLDQGLMYGCSGEGRIASAARADYARAAARVLTSQAPRSGLVLELAGDESYTLSEFAEEVSRQSGKTVAYQNLAQAAYQTALLGDGLPEPVAAQLADAAAGAAQDALFDDSRTLSQLLGHPTLSYKEQIASALGAYQPNAENINPSV